MTIEVNIEPGRKVFCKIDRSSESCVRDDVSEVIHGEFTGQFYYNNGVVEYTVRCLNTRQLYSIQEKDLVTIPDAELQRIDEFFNSFADISEYEAKILRMMFYKEIEELRQRKKAFKKAEQT